MSDPSRVRMSGPLTPFATGFDAELARAGYAPFSRAQHLRLAAHLSCWLEARGLDSHALTEALTGQYLRSRRGAGYATHLSAKALAPLMHHLRALGAAPAPCAPERSGPEEALLARYRRYLSGERGLTPETASIYVDAVRPFLAERPEALALERLRAAEVVAFCVERLPRLSKSRAKQTTTALRSLLGFLHAEGLIAEPLVAAVPAVASWRLQGLPKGLEPDQLARLLGSCEHATTVGRRDHAVLTVLARLGLRAGEVAALRLSDIDWRAGELRVRGKGRRTDRLPLPADVGEAIARYLRDGRPPGIEEQAVFVRALAPHRGLSASGVSGVVARAARRVGLGRVGAHRLRHTAATALLRAGAALPEVGQLLRHRRAETTAIYAKADREALRTIARRWPEGGAR